MGIQNDVNVVRNYRKSIFHLTMLTSIVAAAADTGTIEPTTLLSSALHATPSPADMPQFISTSINDNQVLDKHRHGIPFCDDELERTIGRRLLYVTTLDGRLTALDISKGGKIHWTIPTGPGPLISSSIHRLELTNNGQFVRMIPSLSGGIYKFDGESIDPIPITTDNLLSSSAKFSDDLVVSGGKETRTYGVSARTGKMLYECSMNGCVNSTDAEMNGNVTRVKDEDNLAVEEEEEDEEATENNYGKEHDSLIDDVIVIRRQTQTVRAVETRTGFERWNFSVGQHDLDLIRSAECHDRKFSDMDMAMLDLDIKVIVPEGIICAFSKMDPSVMLWKYKFDHPIVSAWKIGPNDELDPIDMFGSAQWLWNSDDTIYNVPLPTINPSIYLGMYEKQLYIQISRKLSLSKIEILAMSDTEQDSDVACGHDPFWIPTSLEDKLKMLTTCPEISINETIRKKTWSDEVFFKYYVPNSKFKRPTKDMRSAACKRLVQFFHGTRCMYEGVEKDMLVAIVSMASPPLNQQTELFEVIFDDNSGAVIEISPDVVNERVLRSLTQSYFPNNRKDTAFSAADVTTLWTRLLNAIGHLGEDLAFGIIAETACTLVGFYCIYCLGLISKDPQAIWSSMKQRLNKLMKNIYGKDLPYQFYPVSYFCLVELKRLFTESNVSMMNLLGLVIARYLYEEALPTTDIRVLGFLKASCLMQLEMTGLQPIKNLEEVKTRLNLKLNDFLEIITSTKTLDSLLQISAFYRFIAKPCTINHPVWGHLEFKRQGSWRWARLFDSHQLAHLSAKSNTALMIRLSAFQAHYHSKEDILKMHFFKTPAHRDGFEEEYNGFTRIAISKYGPGSKFQSSSVLQTVQGIQNEDKQDNKFQLPKVTKKVQKKVQWTQSEDELDD